MNNKKRENKIEYNTRIPFGPVPSRRLGMSLGVNNIPPKICSYSCVYCQVGKTLKYQTERESFYNPAEVKEQIYKKVKELADDEKRVDYITFVPDGEPTLDINLGVEIKMLKDHNIPVAIISNASLITDKDVRESLKYSDWISLKIDAVTEELWKRINRPHRDLVLSSILDSMIEFREDYRGVLNTETMFVEGINDKINEMHRISDFIKKLNPDRAYLSVPTRPPHLSWVNAPCEKNINAAYNIFKGKIENVELLIGYAGDKFASSGDVVNDILDITAVHPMSREDVMDMLDKSSEDWSIIERMLKNDDFTEVEYDGKKFYIRSFKR